MKALTEKRVEALRMRKRGMSYSQIKAKLGVSKSSLSLWLRGYPLPIERIRELRDWNAQRIENYINTRRKTREKRLGLAYEKAKVSLLPLSEKELFLAGLFLYWGEGGKNHAF